LEKRIGSARPWLLGARPGEFYPETFLKFFSVPVRGAALQKPSSGHGSRDRREHLRRHHSCRRGRMRPRDRLRQGTGTILGCSGHGVDDQAGRGGLHPHSMGRPPRANVAQGSQGGRIRIPHIFFRIDVSLMMNKQDAGKKRDLPRAPDVMKAYFFPRSDTCSIFLRRPGARSRSGRSFAGPNLSSREAEMAVPALATGPKPPRRSRTIKQPTSSDYAADAHARCP